MAGTALAFYPVLKKHAESTTLAYVTFRLLEAGLVIVGAISMLTILALRRDAAQGAAPTAASLQAVDSALRSIRSLTMVIGTDLMLAINTPL